MYSRRFAVYGGYRRQRCAGLFGSFRNYLAQVGRQALNGVKLASNKTEQNREKGDRNRAEVLTSVAVDALQDGKVGESLMERSLETMAWNSTLLITAF